MGGGSTYRAGGQDVVDLRSELGKVGREDRGGDPEVLCVYRWVGWVG